MISRAGFEFVRDIVARRAGLRFAAGSEYLLEARLLPLARASKASSPNEFIRMMQSGAIRDAEQILVEAVVDKETSFFRDVRPFDALRRNVLPELASKRGAERKLSIWSLGCSTGQEAYSVALILAEHFPELLSWELQISASDVSAEALQVAVSGLYNQVEINRGLPIALLVKYFQREGLAWRLKEEIRRMIRFNQMNVLEAWPQARTFDLILVRNVLTGFDPETQAQVLKNVARRLQPDGHVVLGIKETPPAAADCFEEVRFDKVTCYRLKPGAAGVLESEESGGDAAAEGQALAVWAKLARLALRRSAVDPQEAGAMLAGDAGLQTRLLNAVQHDPGIQKGAVNSVEDALSLGRKEHLFAAALTVPLAKALDEAFQSMLSAGLEPVEPSAFGVEGQELISGTARLSGVAGGKVFIRCKTELARELGVQALGVAPEDVGPEVIDDLIGQVMNLIANTVNSSFDSMGLTCRLEAPSVSRGKHSAADFPPRAVHEPLAFQFQTHPIWVDIIVATLDQK